MREPLRRLRVALLAAGSRQVPGRVPASVKARRTERTDIRDDLPQVDATDVDGDSAGPAEDDDLSDPDDPSVRFDPVSLDDTRPRASRPAGRPKVRSRGRGRRRAGNAVRMVLALLLVGGLYTAVAPGVQAFAANAASQDDINAGQQLYDASCISCHGRNGQGVPDKGPSLIGVGSAAVEFQVATGRMPATGQSAQIERRTPLYTREQAQQIGAYIQSLGGGPELPDLTDAQMANGDIARGGTLFRINCSSCHAFGIGGGALSSGKYAPALHDATPRDMWAAMLTGPQNMPVFGNNQLTPDEKRDIIAYIHFLQTEPDPGGWGIGRLGPVAEGLVIFLIGIVALVFATLWIVGKQE